ncbi:MAG: tRNA 2-thiouridine(34) synthase MnmA [Candidatus Omnitrophica bacterium]|nr:tRNA 2-thiouridine(34) synthase MnmA [Candidatus Omnitrophota bacterium]
MKNRKRVMVAMSGGLDSSLSAAILKKKGFDVIGATMKLWPEEECAKDKDVRACCSTSAISDARSVAARIGIPYYVFDFSREFEKNVIDYFCREYNRGATPNPCILCNQILKFDTLLKKTRELSCDYIATGHYANIGYNRLNRRYYVKEGKDKAKDQSYFLAFVSQKALSQTIFPLGGLTKKRARILAKKMGLKVHNKVSSQEICFVDEHYVDYLKRKGAITSGEGDIFNTRGERIGRHKGIHFYTIGQRKGLGVAHKKPLYVVRIDKAKNAVIAGTREEVRKRVFVVSEPSWMAMGGIKRPTKFLTKIRYGHKKAPAVVEKAENGELRVTFKSPQEAITPGQAAVFYKRDVVMGSAWISRVLE